MKNVTILVIIVLVLLCAMLSGCEENTPAPTDSVVVSNKLGTPVLQLNENVVTWEWIDNADYYAVFINGVWQKVVRENRYELTYQVNGDYQVQIYACDSYKNYQSSDYSNTVTYTIDKLDLVEPDLSLKGDVLSWNGVAGATEYEIYVNGIRKTDWLTTSVDGNYTSEVKFETGGIYNIIVKAKSTLEEYEKESSSNLVVYKYSTEKRWYASDLFDEWDLYGGASLYMQWLNLNSGAEGEVAGLANRVLIDENHSYLYLNFNKMEGDNSPMSPEHVVVKVNDTVINPETTNKSVNIPDNIFVYDLRDYVDQIVDISVEVKPNTSMALSQIRLFTRDNVSLMKQWDPTAIAQEWISKGKVEQHAEGFCLECVGGQNASITNMVHIDNQKHLVISFRKFLRIGGEDMDPKVYVYVNNTLVTPQNVSTEYATVSTEAYTPFTYDLSAYIGQDVEIKVVSEQGEHACFSAINLTR